MTPTRSRLFVTNVISFLVGAIAWLVWPVLALGVVAPFALWLLGLQR
jgi:nitrate reductase NapE component